MTQFRTPAPAGTWIDVWKNEGDGDYPTDLHVLQVNDDGSVTVPIYRDNPNIDDSYPIHEGDWMYRTDQGDGAPLDFDDLVEHFVTSREV